MIDVKVQHQKTIIAKKIFLLTKQGRPEMNFCTTCTFALALISGFGSTVACAQDRPPHRQTAIHSDALPSVHSSVIQSAEGGQTRSVVMRADAVGFTEEQLQHITQIPPKTVGQLAMANPTYPPAYTPEYPPAHPASTVQTAVPALSKSRPLRFEITNEDETLYLTLRRWTSETGHQLVWSANKDFPVKRTVYEARDITGAITQVMKDTEFSAYPLHACAYTNRVIRVLHISQSCVPK